MNARSIQANPDGIRPDDCRCAIYEIAEAIAVGWEPEDIGVRPR